MDRGIEFYKTEDGDWEILRCSNDSFIRENHRLDNNDWIDLLEHLGFSVRVITINNDLIQNEDL